MRALLLVILLACGSKAQEPASPIAASTEVRVDRRVELLSFVNALAGFKEYTIGQTNQYRTDFVNHFRPFVNHAAVQKARKLRAEHGIGYDAPMIFAVHLDDELKLVNAAELPSLDKRWTGVDAEAYAAELRAFAADSKLDEFMVAHKDHYAKLETGFRAAVDAEKPVEWFDAVFGKRERARYTVVPSPMTGTSNFGVRATLPDGTLHMYQLISIDTPTGLPVVNDDLVYLLVHEMAHSYINPVLEQHAAALGPPAEKLFAQVKTQMEKQAYPSWQIFLNESVVRATTIVYLGDKKGSSTVAVALDRELAAGFRWTPELVTLMRAYQKDHTDYVPRLVALLTELGQR
ncbi:MAG: DUF4932 domain-containing protein [Deltaproteobacteria bacterium]|nr:DUF4932 domain-containing protein [Deltaproteobacteria bacterium]